MKTILENRMNRIVLLALTLLAILSLIGSFLAHARSGGIDWFAWGDGALQNFGTEMLGAIATFLFFEVVLGSRREQDRQKDAELRRQEEIERDKKRLKRQAGSVNHSIAINAVEELRANGWLTKDDKDPLLVDAKLQRANLEKAPLQDANLSRASFELADCSRADFLNANCSRASFELADCSGADFYEADCSGAYFRGADCNSAKFWSADCSGADFYEADCSGAYFRYADCNSAEFWSADCSGADFLNANLSGCDLPKTNLASANLMGANLRDTRLSHTAFDEKTVLPDAKYLRDDDEGKPIFDKYWTSETNMSRYTNPEHPDFWQPDWEAIGFDSWQEWLKASQPRPDEIED